MLLYFFFFFYVVVLDHLPSLSRLAPRSHSSARPPCFTLASTAAHCRCRSYRFLCRLLPLLPPLLLLLLLLLLLSRVCALRSLLAPALA